MLFFLFDLIFHGRRHEVTMFGLPVKIWISYSGDVAPASYADAVLKHIKKYGIGDASLGRINEEVPAPAGVRRIVFAMSRESIPNQIQHDMQNGYGALNLTAMIGE